MPFPSYIYHNSPMTIDYLLFDLDNTLYPESSGMQQEIHRRMTAYVARYLGISEEKAAEARRSGFLNHGTTLRWLQLEHGLRTTVEFLEQVHPEDVEPFIPENPALTSFLDSLPYPKAVFTNSPHFHAQRVLERLGIRSCFTHVFDITFNDLEGKPHPASYRRVLSALNVPAEKTVFIDDAPSYVQGFIDVGGIGVLIDEFGRYGDLNAPRIPSLWELPNLLTGLP